MDQEFLRFINSDKNTLHLSGSRLSGRTHGLIDMISEYLLLNPSKRVLLLIPSSRQLDRMTRINKRLKIYLDRIDVCVPIDKGQPWFMDNIRKRLTFGNYGLIAVDDTSLDFKEGDFDIPAIIVKDYVEDKTVGDIRSHLRRKNHSRDGLPMVRFKKFFNQNTQESTWDTRYLS